MWARNCCLISFISLWPSFVSLNIGELQAWEASMARILSHASARRVSGAAAETAISCVMLRLLLNPKLFQRAVLSKRVRCLISSTTAVG